MTLLQELIVLPCVDGEIIWMWGRAKIDRQFSTGYWTEQATLFILSQTALKGGTWVQEGCRRGAGGGQEGAAQRAGEWTRAGRQVSAGYSLWSVLIGAAGAKQKRKWRLKLKVYSQTVWKTKKNLNLAFCEKCESNLFFFASFIRSSSSKRLFWVA